MLRHRKKKTEELTLSNKNHTRKNCSKKQKMVLGKLDIHMQNNEIKPSHHTTHKN